MFNALVERVSGSLSRSTGRDQEVLAYGVEVALLQLLTVLGFVLVGLVFGRFWHTMLWAASLLLLRMPGGGFHASTRTRCQLLTLVICAACVAAMPYVPMLAAPIMSLAALGVTIALAPVIHPNQPLSDKTAHKQRRFALSVAILSCAAVAACLLIGGETARLIAVDISLGSFCAAALAVAGFVEAKRAGARGAG